MKENVNTSKYAPLILFTYNRIDVLKKTVKSLSENYNIENTELFIFSDGPKDNRNDTLKVNEVRDYIKSIKKFTKNVTFYEHEKNLGLANSIIDGVSKIINKHGKVIVLEDDLITSPYFLKFMNEALNVYQDNEKIYSITGFNFSTEFMNFPDDFIDDVYLNIRPMSWSWHHGSLIGME